MTHLIPSINDSQHKQQFNVSAVTY